MKPDAIIFDMDGTLMNNNPYHFKAWQAFYQKYHRTLSLEDYKTEISGHTSVEIFQTFFGKEMTREEIATHANEKNLLYRELYKPYIKPIDGLIHFLNEIKEANIPMNIATSGSPANVRFMFEHIPIAQYFGHVVDASEVVKGKPDPEIFLKAAQLANAEPARCVAFEDSLAGIASAKGAGMKVVGITTMESKDDLKETDLIIDDYIQINLEMLEKLFDK